MHQAHLKAVDLNLLKILVEIETRGSVTAAAEALGVGQPAVSQALSRLREALQDDLFIRTAGGMTPTPRLRELVGPIRSSLGQIEQVLFGPQDFDPQRTETRYRIGLSDYAASLLTDRLLSGLAQRMPRASVSLLRADKADAMQLLRDGKIDLAIGLFSKAEPWIRRRRLLVDSHICVFNPLLVTLPDPLTLETYAAQDHLLVSQDGSSEGFVDAILRDKGLGRRIVMTTPFFLHCSDLLQSLPCIATLPKRFVESRPTLQELSRRSLPFEAPEFSVSAAWRASDDKDPRLRSLQSVIFPVGGRATETRWDTSGSNGT